MERKLERCIRLRFVSLCTCVCTRVCLWVYVSDLSVSVATKEYQQNIDQPLKIINVVFVFNTSLGAFARWKAPSIPRCGRRWRRRRENVKNATAVAAMVAAFTARWAFAAFVLCFCFRSVCVLLASWWYKLSMRLLNFFLLCRRTFRIRIRGSRSALVLVHTASLSNCPCVRVSSRTCCFSGVHNFPLSIFSFRRMCMCRISPFFRRNRSAFPSFYWFDFWALPLYWYWFQRLPNKLFKLARASWHFAFLARAGARFFPVPRGKVRYVRAPLQLILSMMSPMWGVCLLVDFSRLSKNRLNPKRAHSCLAAVFGNFWTCSTLFCFVAWYSRKNETHFDILFDLRKREFLEASLSVRFSELGPLRVIIQLV